MDFWQYAASLLVSSLGLLAGGLIGHFASYELRLAERYLLLAEDVLLLALGWTLWNAGLFAPWISALIGILILLLLVHPRWAQRHARALGRLRLSIVPYVLFALALFAGKDGAQFPLLASIVFLFGIPAGSLWVSRDRRWHVHVALKMAVLLVAGIAFWVLQ